MLRQNQQNLRLMSTHATEEDVEQPPQNGGVDRSPEVHMQNPGLSSTHITEECVEQPPPKNEGVDRFPQVHHVLVKRKGRNNDWEKVKTIFTQQRARNDSVGRACQRRVWISFSGSEPTKEELALGWPQDKQEVVRGKLCDRKEHEIYDDDWDVTVTEKKGEDGRRFWRETRKRLADEVEQEFVNWKRLHRLWRFFEGKGLLKPQSP